jgi:hypothetical protein
LIFDLLEWIGPDGRPYAEVIEAWRPARAYPCGKKPMNEASSSIAIKSKAERTSRCLPWGQST